MPTTDKENTLFLLGGHDLEMCTIRDLLVLHGYHYRDRNLQWNNARLSQYTDDISRFLTEVPDGNIFGIELENDLPRHLAGYHCIDHHNRLSECPSALEQVLTLLQLTPTHRQLLIAANDSAYIPGMQALGATREEIDEIRQADRRAQGVTDADEQQAETAIRTRLRQAGRLYIVHALTSRFSPICDRLYPYRSLLVYTSTEWTYYGQGAERIRRLFIPEIEQGKLYYGGGKDGYVGSKKNVYTETEILKMIKRIEHESI